MPQVWIDIEDNDNCGYFPMQTFEVRGVERAAGAIVIADVSNVDGPCEVVGWDDGGPCELRVVKVGDSGAGESLLVHGSNHGIRLRPRRASEKWSLDSGEQFGEPYMLLPYDTEIEYLDSDISNYNASIG